MPCRGDLESCAIVVGPAAGSRAVEVAVAASNERGGTATLTGAEKGEESGQLTRWIGFEDRVFGATVRTRLAVVVAVFPVQMGCTSLDWSRRSA